MYFVIFIIINLILNLLSFNLRNMQEIQLDKHIKLLDCPGVVLDKTSTTDSVALKNVVSSGNIEDPIACAATIVSRVTKDQVI